MQVRRTVLAIAIRSVTIRSLEEMGLLMTVERQMRLKFAVDHLADSAKLVEVWPNVVIEHPSIDELATDRF